MKQYIDKSAVIAEIERRKQTWQHQDQQYVNGGKDVCDYLLGFLDTLEVKNFIWNNTRTTVPEDSTNQIICIKEDGLAVLTIGKIVNGTVKWAYLDDLLNTNSFNVEVKEVDLNEHQIADIIQNLFPTDRFIESETLLLNREEALKFAKHFFKLGLTQKGGKS